MKNNRTSALWIAGAFLLGAGGASAVMSKRFASVSAPESAEAAAPESAALENDGVIKLNPIAVKNAGIRVETVRTVPLRAALVVSGSVEASAGGVAKITPPAPGKIMRLLVDLGDHVSFGQGLAALSSPDVAQAQAAVRAALSEERQSQGRVQVAYAEVSQAMDRAGAAQTALERQEALAKAGAFAQAPLQAAQSEQSQAQSEMLQSQSELQNRMAAEARAQKLFTAGVTSRAEWEQAQTDRRQSQIREEQAQARVGQAQQTLKRETSVFGQGLLSSQAVQTARAELTAARGDVRRLRTQARSARTALAGARDAVASARMGLRAIVGRERATSEGEIILRAPMGGVVTQRAVTLGEAVERGGALMTIQNLGSVTVQANIREQDVARVRAGQPVTVSVASYPGRTFPGVVQSLGGALDEKTRTLPVRCLVRNSEGKLRPEMFAEVSVATDKMRSGLAVPKNAVIDDEGGGKAIYVAENGGYRKLTVRTGLESNGRVEVSEGLKSGQQVVTDGAFVLLSEAGKSALKDED